MGELSAMPGQNGPGWILEQAGRTYMLWAPRGVGDGRTTPRVQWQADVSRADGYPLANAAGPDAAAVMAVCGMPDDVVRLFEVVVQEWRA